MGRLGSRVLVSASFQIFALTAGGMGGKGNCPGGENARDWKEYTIPRQRSY